MSHFTAASHLPRRQTPPNVSTLPAGARQLTAFEQQIRDLSPVFSQLLSIKYEYRIHPDVVEKFDARREQQLHTSSASNASYRIEWEKVIWAISEAHGQCFQHDRVHRFLDLGCSPGGFSNWLLESNPAAEGVGVTLPNGQARFPIDTSGTYLSQSRYQLLFGDIIDITLSSIPGSTNPLTRLGAPDGILRQYDFIVAGAFPTLADNVSFWHRTKLALCQVLIAFVNIEAGGSLMLVIKTKPFRWLVELVALLRRSFAVVTATGGRGSHAIRSSSYLICRRFRATSEQRKTAIETIRSALRILDDLTSGATPSHQNTGDGHRNERSVPLLERCSDEQLIQREGTSFLELLEPQWQAQERAIRDDLKRYSEAQTTQRARTSPTTRTNPNGFPWFHHAPATIATDVPLSGTRPSASPTSPRSPVWRRPPHGNSTATTASPPSESSSWRSERRNEEPIDGEAQTGSTAGFVANPVFGRGYRSTQPGASSSTTPYTSSADRGSWR